MATQTKQATETKNLPAVQKMLDFRQELMLRERAYTPLLPSHINWQRFQATVWSAVAANQDLLDCHRATMFKACAEAAELGLSLNPALKEADILKVWNGRINGYEAQFRPRYMGLMKLAKQSGEIKNITAHEVYEWDHFEYEHGLNERLEHKPGPKPMDYANMPNWGITHAYCVWTEMDGTKKFEVMELADILRIRARSSAKNKGGEVVGPWVSDFAEMARKTVVRRASKYMPLSAEKAKPFMNAVNLDDRREGGEEVSLQHGDIVDVTDGGGDQSEPEQAQQPTEAGKSQMDQLQQRMQGQQPAQKQPAQTQQPRQNAAQPEQQKKAEPPKQAPKPQQQGALIENPPQPKPEAATPKQRIARLEIPNGDMTAWVRLAEAEVKPLDAGARKAWKTLHDDLLDACEYNCPDETDMLRKMLG